MSVVGDDKAKTWIVYLPDGQEIYVAAHYVVDHGDGRIYFKMGGDDLAVTVAKFLEANIAGYKLVEGLVIYGYPSSGMKTKEGES